MFKWNLILLVFTTFSFIKKSSPWKINVVPKDGKNEVITGFYKAFNLTFESEGNKQRKGYLVIPDDDANKGLVLLDTLGYVDTHLSKTYTIYIGLTCSHQYAMDEDATVKLSLSSLIGKVSTDSIGVSFKIKPSSQGAPLAQIYPLLRQMPTDSYGLYILKNGDVFMNTEAVNVTVSHEPIHDNLTVTSLEIPKFDYVDDNLLQEVGRFEFKSDFDPKKENFTVTVKPIETTNPSCYSVDKTGFDFTINRNGLAHFSTVKRRKENILNRLVISKEGAENRITVQVSLPENPAVVTCLVQRDNGDLPSDDAVVECSSFQSQDQKCIKKFVNNTGTAFFMFEEMSRLGGYKMKCVVENTAIHDDEKERLSFTVGNFDGADLRTELTKSGIQPIEGQCLSMELSGVKDDDLDKIEEALMIACNDDFDKKYSNIEGTVYDKGCYQCEQRGNRFQFFSKLHRVGICFTSIQSCRTSFIKNAEDTKKDFKEVMDKYTDKQVINELMKGTDISVKEVRGIIYESEDEVPTADWFEINKIELDDKVANITIRNKKNRFVECYFKNNLLYKDSEDIDPENYKDSRDPVEETKLEDLKGRLYYFDRGEEKKITLSISGEGFCHEILTINAYCSVNPGSSYHSRFSKNLVLGAFFDTDKAPAPYNKGDKADCSKKPITSPQCINILGHKQIKFASRNIKDSDDDYDVNYFGMLTEEHRRAQIEYHNKTLSESKSINDVLGEIMYIAQLLSVHNCSASVNYAECIKEKRKYFKYILSVYREYFPKGKLIERMKEHFDLAGEEGIVKLVVQTVFFLSNVPDCLDNDTYTKVVDIIEEEVNMRQNLTVILGSRDDTELDSFTDVIKTILATTVNLVDINIYYMLNNKLTKDSKDKKADLFTFNEITKKQKGLTDNVTIDLWEFGVEEFKYDALSLRLIQKHPSIDFRRLSKSSENLRSEEGGLREAREIEFPTIAYLELNDVTVYIGQSIFSAYKGEVIFAYTYARHPYASYFEDTSYLKEFVGLKLYSLETQGFKEVKGIKSAMRPEILFHVSSDKLKSQKYQSCGRFDENKKQITDSGISTQLYKNGTEIKYIGCSVKDLGEITLTTSPLPTQTWRYIGIISLIILILVVLIIVVIFVVKKRKTGSVIDGNENEAVPMSNTEQMLPD